jgi:hypothetical protein
MLANHTIRQGLLLKIEWPWWLMSAADAWGLHDQDCIHNGKKLINPLDSLMRSLQLGANTCFLERIGLVYNKYTFDQHGLQLGDIQRIDKHNWASSQKICRLKFYNYLKLLQSCGDTHQEKTLGTELYLKICAYYINIFLLMTLDLQNIIVLASKMSFFFHLWKLWLKHGDCAMIGNPYKV